MLLRKVQKTIKKYEMLDRADRVLVAVSGGPDSAALLDVLFSLRDKYDLSLSVAHLNHMLRGKEAEEDVHFVKGLSKNLGLPFFPGKRNVLSFMKKTHLSPEQAGRKLRYDFLRGIAKREGMNKIALGQTADDQAETVLLALLRGSGLAGLSGIPPVRMFEKPGIRIVRPLIETFRVEIEKYLEGKGITARLDASNLEPIYLRNKIRHELLPLIASEYNPKIKLALVKLAGILQEDNRYLIEETRKLAPQMLSNYSGDVAAGQTPACAGAANNSKAKGVADANINKYVKKVKINLRKFRAVPAALQQRLVREAVNKICGNMRPLSLIHWERIHELVEGGRTGSYIVLPDGVVVRKEYGDLLIMVEPARHKVSELDYELEIPGKNYIPEIGLIVNAHLFGREDVSLLGGGKAACFDCDRIKFPLHIRFRKDGDRFSPLGMKGSKKLKDFFIDRKVPAGERDEVPLLLSNGEIIWVMDPGENGWGRMGEKVKVSEKTTRVLHVEVVTTSRMCYNGNGGF
jgi:tRNA(Ile)-lysidine synthase